MMFGLQNILVHHIVVMNKDVNYIIVLNDRTKKLLLFIFYMNQKSKNAFTIHFYGCN